MQSNHFKKIQSMKKILLYSFALCAMVFALTSCDDDEQLTDSRLTYYAVIDIQGDEFVEVPIGSSYTDAGCIATIQGEDVTSRVTVDGVDDIDVNSPGLYYVTYSVVNDDGFATSATRTVAVCDPSVTTDLSGTWTTQEGTYRSYKGNIVTSAYAGLSINITKAAPGIFYVTDFFGGFYDQRAAYGKNYAMYGYMQLTADNELVCLSSHVNGWGDSIIDFEGAYDPEAGTLTWDALYVTDPDMIFHVILKQ